MTKNRKSIHELSTDIRCHRDRIGVATTPACGGHQEPRLPIHSPGDRLGRTGKNWELTELQLLVMSCRIAVTGTSQKTDTKHLCQVYFDKRCSSETSVLFKKDDPKDQPLATIRNTVPLLQQWRGCCKQVPSWDLLKPGPSVCGWQKGSPVYWRRWSLCQLAHTCFPLLH